MKPVLCAAVSSPSELTDKAADYAPAVYKLTVGDVPVAGFWSLTVYNSEGYLQPNPDSVYSVNNTTAKKGPDGSVIVQFAGCEGKVPNCLPDHPRVELHGATLSPKT